MRTSQPGIDFIKSFEGYRNRVYYIGGAPHIGYGHLIKPSEPHLLTNVISEAEAVALLANDLAQAEAVVNSQIFVPLNQDQYNALVSLVFNIGASAFATSTVKGRINNKFSQLDIAEAWERWNKDEGVILPGLVARRSAEVLLYFTGVEVKKKACTS